MLALGFALSIPAIGCGGSSGADDPSDGCDDLASSWETCGGEEEIARDIDRFCETVEAAEGQDEACDDALTEYFECLTDLSCDELLLEDSENRFCSEEGDDRQDACGDLLD